MGRAQLRAAAGEAAIQVAARLPLVLRAGQVGQWLERATAAAVPPVAGRLPDEGDAGFAYRRFAGMNPMTIRRVRAVEELPPGLALDDATLSALLGASQSFAERLQRGELYLLDLRVL